MAFNKVCMVLLVLLVATTLANARMFENESSAGPNFCSSCECKEEYGVRKCYRSDTKVGGCPIVCGEPCLCNRMIPPTCWCQYEVDTCSPSVCSAKAGTKFIDVLGLNGKN